MGRKGEVMIWDPSWAGVYAVKSFLSMLGVRQYADQYCDGNKSQARAEYSKLWKDIVDQYKCRCGYCGRLIEDGKIHRDHIIPMNKDHGGVDHPGNWMPCCSTCNSKEKKERDWREYLEDKYKKDTATLNEIVAIIEAHQRKYDYPLEENQVVRAAAQELYQEAAAAVWKNLELMGCGKKQSSLQKS